MAGISGIVSNNANNIINLPCPPYYCDVSALPANIMHNLVFADSVHKRYCIYAKISHFHVHPRLMYSNSEGRTSCET